MNARTVLLYGRSLLLSGVAAGLAEHPQLRVKRAATWADARRLLAEQMPDVVIFDLTSTCEGHILPLLLENPGLMMVGLDTERNQAVLISGQSARSLTLAQIAAIAEEGSGATEC